MPATGAAKKRRKVPFEELKRAEATQPSETSVINTPYSSCLLGTLSLHLAPWFINRGIHPNTITGLAFLILLAAFAMILLGALSRWFVSLAGILLHGVLVLDNIDGMVARYEERVSRAGALFDALVSWLHYSLLPLFVSLLLVFGPPQVVLVSVERGVPAWIWLLAGLTRALACLLTIAQGKLSETLLEGRSYAVRTRNPGRLTAVKAVMESEAPLLVLAGAVGFLGFLHLAYSLLHLAILFAALGVNLRDLAARDRQPSAGPGVMPNTFQRIRDLAQPFLSTRRNDIHTRIAEALARELLATEGGDEAVVIPAVLLHDVGWKAVPEELQQQAFGPRASRPDLNRLHEREGARIAGEILAAVSYDAARTAEIVSIIESHDSCRTPDSLNARHLVSEADKLWRYTREGLEIDLARFDESSEQGLKRLESNLDAWFRTATA